MKPLIARTRGDLRDVVAGWRRDGLSVGVVPTMGALHAGHLALVAAAQNTCDRVIVTIFVNPKQFNNSSDLAAYPRTEAGDVAALAAHGVDLAYLPEAGEIYPPGFSTRVEVEGVSEGLCGTFRPGHFAGVATVVTKLLLQTAPDRAFFGEKDFQQLRVIERTVRDLDIPVEIVGCPTVREAGGLALSSRNVRLSQEERVAAAGLPRALFRAAGDIAAGVSVRDALAQARQALGEAGFRAVEYLELRSADTLAPLDRLDRPARLLVAAWLGETRLIDNVPVQPAGASHCR